MSKTALKQIKVSAEQFPSLKNEDWRYTEVAHLLGTYVVPVKAVRPKHAAMRGDKSPYGVTFVDGFLVHQNLPRGVALVHNTLTIADGVKLDAPLTIEYRGEMPAATWTTQLALKLGANSSAAVSEEYHLAQDSFAKTKLSMTLEQSSALTHVVSSVASATQHSTARVISNHTSVLGERATYRAGLVSAGVRFARHEVAVSLNGLKASADLRGVQMQNGTAQVSTHISVDHRAPQTRSTQTFRGVVRGAASSVCHSKVFIRKVAHQATSDQLLKTILLDPQAKGFARPELHVANDQVQCRHGSAVGPLSKESLFYLKSRGFTDEQARNTLVRAFVMTDLESDQQQCALVEEALS